MKIVVVAAAAESIKANLETMLPGNVIIGYNNIYSLYDFASKSALRADVMIVDDKGIFAQPVTDKNLRECNDRFNTLDDLFLIRYLNIDKVYFLNKTENPSFLEKYKFLEEVVKKNGLHKDMKFVISTQDEHRVTDIKKLLMSFDKKYTSEMTRNVIVQRKRGEELTSSGLLTPFETDKALVVLLRPEGKVDAQHVKSLYSNNNEPIDISEETLDIPAIHYIQDLETRSDEKLIEDKMILVTGTANSGVTTTTMMLAHSALAFGGKVLIVDLNTDNMGLSYLASEVLYPESKIEKEISILADEDISKDKIDVTLLDLAEVYRDGPIVLERDSMSSNRLHVLTTSLPLIDAVKDIQFMIINILERISSNYRYVIFDVPLKCLDMYPVLASRYVDRVVLTNIPYMNKMVSALSELKRSYLPNMKAFKNNKVVALSIGVADRNGMLPISREIYKTYSEHFLGAPIPCTGIFSMSLRDYYKPTIFNELMSYNGKVVQEYLSNVEITTFSDNKKTSQTKMRKKAYVNYNEDPVHNLTGGKETSQEINDRQDRQPTENDINILGHSNLAMLVEENFTDIVEDVVSSMPLEEELGG